MTVPASPQSLLVGSLDFAQWSYDAASDSLIGSMRSQSASSSMTAPSPRRVSIISSVSRLRSQPLRSESDWARAARMRYRFVSDLDPGTETVAVMPDAAAGACQSPAAGSVSVGMSVNSERTQRLLEGVFDVRPQVLSGMLGPPPQSGTAGRVDTGQQGSAEHGCALQGAFGAGLLLFLRCRLLRGQALTDGVEQVGADEDRGADAREASDRQQRTGRNLGDAGGAGQSRRVHGHIDLFASLVEQGTDRSCRRLGAAQSVDAVEDVAGGQHGPCDEADGRHCGPSYVAGISLASITAVRGIVGPRSDVAQVKPKGG